jgi:hypothetical protein
MIPVSIAFIEATAKQTSVKRIRGPRIFMHNNAPLNQSRVTFGSERSLSLCSLHLEEFIPVGFAVSHLTPELVVVATESTFTEQKRFKHKYGANACVVVGTAFSLAAKHISRL